MQVTVRQQVQARARANTALQQLAAHPATSQQRLGAGRDQLNKVMNRSEHSDVVDALTALEANVLDLYARHPQH